MNRLSVCIRLCGCICLLLLLAVSGYMGAKPQSVQMTAAPVIMQHAQDVSGMEYEEIITRQEKERLEEIALLDSVIESSAASKEEKDSALAQKIQLAERMETESSVRAALLHMGYREAAVLCGAGQITLIVPQSVAAGEEDTLRMIDAAAAAAQIEAKNVKIILVKK